MKTIYVADTHALIWYLAADDRLGAQAKAVLANPDSVLVIPAIVVAECLYIIEHKKTNASSARIWELLSDYENIIFYPLDTAVLQRTETIAASIPEMHDRQIVATALMLSSEQTEVRLITKDGIIAESKLVPVLW